jgi:hypothetical protein
LFALALLVGGKVINLFPQFRFRFQFHIFFKKKS